MRRWTPSALVVLVATVAAPAWGQGSSEIALARPVSPRAPTSMTVCLRSPEGCGSLDEDGLMPLWIAVPPGSSVWLDDELLPHDAAGVIRVDLMRFTSRDRPAHETSPSSSR